MAASPPPTPDEAKLIISDVNAQLCGNFTRTLLREPVLFYNLISFLFDAAGVPTNTFRAGDKKESFAPMAEDEHWKLCNGQALDKTTYAVLYAAIGDVYNTMAGPDGTAQSAPGGNLFRVPNCQARFALTNGSLPVGGAVGNGDTGGEEQHVLTESELAKHNHPTTINWDSDSAGPGNEQNYTSVAGGEVDGTLTTGDLLSGSLTAESAKAGGDAAHNNLPPYYGIYVYICTGI